VPHRQRRNSDDQFDPAFQACLAKHGYEMGKANPIPCPGPMGPGI
jgi:hypothetical protein